MQSVDVTLTEGKIEGFCDERFRSVALEFEKNFRERGEVGASVSLTLGGQTVVDLWGGMARRKDGTPWKRDTLSIVYSCTKGMTALCAHILESRGKLDIEAPVAEYWPEFAKCGKERATVRMMLDHSVGLPAFKTPLRADGCTDWEYMTQMLAAEEPFWVPGSRSGYHMINFGWTVGEIVRRVSGKSLGTFFRDEVAQPLGADFYIGAPEAIESRVAPIIAHRPDPNEPPSEFTLAIVTDPQSISALSLLNTGGFDANSRACHAAEIGGAGGISNARAMARIYGALACGGTLDGVRLVDRKQIARMSEVASATQRDATLLLPSRFSLGFMKSQDNRRRAFGDRDSAILSASAFGHAGAGGSLGFADPQAGLGFSYTMNRMGPGILLNSRGQSLVDAAYKSLGYTGNDSGFWTA
jgi:CubicO group peptidase (beta-lactamase class C family)